MRPFALGIDRANYLDHWLNLKYALLFILSIVSALSFAQEMQDDSQKDSQISVESEAPQVQESSADLDSKRPFSIDRIRIKHRIENNSLTKKRLDKIRRSGSWDWLGVSLIVFSFFVVLAGCTLIILTTILPWWWFLVGIGVICFAVLIAALGVAIIGERESGLLASVALMLGLVLGGFAL